MLDTNPWYQVSKSGFYFVSISLFLEDYILINKTYFKTLKKVFYTNFHVLSHFYYQYEIHLYLENVLIFFQVFRVSIIDYRI